MKQVCFFSRSLLLLVIVVSIFSCAKNDETVSNESDEEFIHYTVNGVAYAYDKPVDVLLANDSAENSPFIPSAFVTGQRDPALPGDFAKIAYQTAALATGSQQALSLFTVPQVVGIYPHEVTSPTPVSITIIEYGMVGQYIAGNFSATLTATTAPYSISVIACSFRIKRRI